MCSGRHVDNPIVRVRRGKVRKEEMRKRRKEEWEKEKEHIINRLKQTKESRIPEKNVEEVGDRKSKKRKMGQGNILYSILCTVYRIPSSVYSLLYTVYSIHYTYHIISHHVVVSC
jgi:hypothetical protein